MTKNIGTKDRVFRLILGIIFFIGATLSEYGILQIALIIAGVFCVFQATFSWCAWYALIGKTTCPIEK